MKYLETILSFVWAVARVILRQRRGKKAEGCDCGLPDGGNGVVGMERADGDRADCHRGDPDAVRRENPTAKSVNVMGWCIILFTVVGSLFF